MSFVQTSDRSAVACEIAAGKSAKWQPTRCSSCNVCRYGPNGSWCGGASVAGSPWYAASAVALQSCSRSAVRAVQDGSSRGSQEPMEMHASVRSCSVSPECESATWGLHGALHRAQEQRSRAAARAAQQHEQRYKCVYGRPACLLTAGEERSLVCDSNSRSLQRLHLGHSPPQSGKRQGRSAECVTIRQRFVPKVAIVAHLESW